MEEEIWKDIEGYEGAYQVSNLGNVKSLRCYNGHDKYIMREKILKPRINTYGYYRVSLRKDGKTRDYFIHRLVADAFLDKPSEDCEIDHIDTNRINNIYTNLRWVTHKENMNNPISVQKQVGENNHMYGKDNYSKSRSYIIQCIETGISYRSIRAASRETGIPFSSIQKHLQGILDNAGGYHWRIVEKGSIFLT